MAMSSGWVRHVLPLAALVVSTCWVQAHAQTRPVLADRMRLVGEPRPMDSVEQAAAEVAALMAERRWTRILSRQEAWLPWTRSAPADEGGGAQLAHATPVAQIHYALALACLETGQASQAIPHLTASFKLVSDASQGLHKQWLGGILDALHGPGNPLGDLLRKSSPETLPKIEAELQAEQRDGRQAARREAALRLLLDFHATQAYLAQVAPWKAALARDAQDDPSGECADALAMEAFVRGDRAACERYLAQCRERAPGSRALDARSLLADLADGRTAGIDRPLRTHALNAINSRGQFPDVVRVTLQSLLGSPEIQTPGDRREGPHQGALTSPGDSSKSFLLSAIPAVVRTRPDCSRVACEVALMLKKDKARSLWSAVRERERAERAERDRAPPEPATADDWTNRMLHDLRENEAKRQIEDARLLGQFASSCLLARPPGELSAAFDEAQFIYRWPRAFCPGRKPPHPSFDSEAGPAVELAAIQRRLSAGQAVVEMAMTDEIDIGQLHAGLCWNTPRYVGWLIKPSGDPIFIDIGARDEVDRLVAACRRAVARTGGRSADPVPPEEDHGDEAALGALAGRVLQPIANDLATVKRLTICPDGSLWLVPWAAAPWKADVLLIEQCELVYALTAAGLTARPQPSGMAPGESAIFAGVDYDLAPQAILAAESKQRPAGHGQDPIVVPLRGGRSILGPFGPLAATETEAQAAKASIAAIGKKPPRVFLGADALESVARSLTSPEFLLFSTHGIFLPLPPVTSAAPGGAEKKAESDGADGWPASHFLSTLSADYRVLDLINNPFVRCGLALAGANTRDQWAEVRSADGILTGMEAALLDLRGTKLVVLSACDTGLGDLASGEGVAGLRQAFLAAGAAAVASTLWRVEDRATADLIRDMFTALRDSPSPAAALRKAQLQQLAQRRANHGAAQPYYWAAFTLTER